MQFLFPPFLCKGSPPFGAISYYFQVANQKIATLRLKQIWHCSLIPLLEHFPSSFSPPDDTYAPRRESLST